MLSFLEAQASLYLVFEMIAEDDVRIVSEETDTSIHSISIFQELFLSRCANYD